MTFTYKARSEIQKDKKLVKKKKLVKTTPASQTYDNVCISYRSHCNNPNDCVQMVRFINHSFEKHNYYKWTSKNMDNVKKAIELALEKLNKALSDQCINDNIVIKDAIESVIGIFTDEELEIFPLFENYYGQARQGFKQISINMELLQDKPFALAKTLIHEAFHIIGGCKKGKSLDLICADHTTKEAAFANICRKRSRETMDADFFAQFVMQC